MCILTIYLSLSVKCLFKSGAYFLKIIFYCWYVGIQLLGWGKIMWKAARLRSKMASSQEGRCCWVCTGSSAGAVHGLPLCGLSSMVSHLPFRAIISLNQAEATWPFQWSLKYLVTHPPNCVGERKDTKSTSDLGEKHRFHLMMGRV